MRMMMMRGIALLLLVCQQMDVHGHTLSRHTANINTKLKVQYTNQHFNI